MTYVQTLDVAVRASEEWVDEFMRRLGWHDRELVYAALIAGLHALRDSLPEAVLALGEGGLGRFDRSLLPKIRLYAEEAGAIDVEGPPQEVAPPSN